MSSHPSNSQPDSEQWDDDMLPEYDFTAGVRGKHAQAYRQGHTVTIYKADGTTEVQIPPDDEIIVLDADVRAHFPDSAAVNRALRSLINSDS